MINILMIATFRYPKNWSKYKKFARRNPDKMFYCVSNGMPSSFCDIPNLTVITKGEALLMSFDIGVLFSYYEGSANVLKEYVDLWNMVVCHDNPGDSLNVFIPGLNALSENSLNYPCEVLKKKIEAMTFKNEIPSSNLDRINISD